jgi:hypothetical protein
LSGERAGQSDHLRSLDGGKKNVSGQGGKPPPVGAPPGLSGRATSAQWTRRIRRDGRWSGCPSPDVHRRPPESWPEPLRRAELYGVG